MAEIIPIRYADEFMQEYWFGELNKSEKQRPKMDDVYTFMKSRGYDVTLCDVVAYWIRVNYYPL